MLNPADDFRKKRLQTLASFALIFGMTVFWMFSVAPVPEYSSDASAYVGLAQSIRTDGSYRLNNEHHTVYPPGFPIVLVLLSFIYAHDPVDSYRFFMICIALFAGVGLLTAYWLVRNELSWTHAMIYVGLLGTSPFLFQACTRSIQSDICYALTSLWAIVALEQMTRRTALKGSGRLWMVLFAFSFLISLMIRAIGVALLIALVLCCLLLSVRMPRGMTITLFAVVIMGIMVEGAWAYWMRINSVPPVPGDTTYGDFWRKDPHDPDRGSVRAWEMAVRPVLRLPEEISHITEFCFLNKWINPVPYSPLIVFPVLFIFAGVLEYLTAARADFKLFYFLSYLGILLFWPYDVGPRYIFPILPFCFIYLCRGWNRCVSWAGLSGRVAWKVLALLSGGGILCGAIWEIVSRPGRVGGQAKVTFLFWSVVLMFALVAMRTAVSTWIAGLGTLRIRLGWLAYTYVACICAAGLLTQTKMAQANASDVESAYDLYPTAEAARWLRDHASADTVVMSSHPWVIHGISHHRVIMFPASRNPEAIMQVARNHHASFLVVVQGASWFLPPEPARLDSLLRAYPAALESAHIGSGYRIYRFRRPVTVNPAP